MNSFNRKLVCVAAATLVAATVGCGGGPDVRFSDEPMDFARLEAELPLTVEERESITPDNLKELSQEQVDSLRYEERSTSIYPLRAPFAGTIVELHATLGELVTPERNLFTLADLDRVWIWMNGGRRNVRSGRRAAGVPRRPDELNGGLAQSSVYLRAVPRALSTGYLMALRSILAEAAASRSI